MALVGAPPGVLDGLPTGVTVKRQARGQGGRRGGLLHRAAGLRAPHRCAGPHDLPGGRPLGGVAQEGLGVVTTMDENVVRAVALPLGLVDNKVCAIDETWSGLRVVWRRERR